VSLWLWLGCCHNPITGHHVYSWMGKPPNAVQWMPPLVWLWRCWKQSGPEGGTGEAEDGRKLAGLLPFGLWALLKGHVWTFLVGDSTFLISVSVVTWTPIYTLTTLSL
jgi:hypothetical protein